MGKLEDTSESHTMASFTVVKLPVLKNQSAKRIDDPLIRMHEDEEVDATICWHQGHAK